MYLISDNVDTLTGMRLAGVDGIVVHERGALRTAIETAMDDKEVGVILLTEKFGREFPDPVSYTHLGSQSYDFGTVCFCDHRQTGSEQRESYNKWDDFFKFFHNQSVFSPFLLYLVYYPNIPYTGLFANEIYLNNS